MTLATLETARLLLRPFTVADAQAFFALGSHPEVTRYTGDGPLRDVEHARAILLSHPLADYQKYGYGRWACIEKACGELIGFAGLKFLDDLQEVDLGYRLLPRCWGRGLATEAALVSIDYGFRQLRLARLLGLVMPENTRSVRVLEKCGFTFDTMIDHHSKHAARYVLQAPMIA